jgi:hypothetical protein
MKQPTIAATYADILAAGWHVSMTTHSDGTRHACEVTLTSKTDCRNVRRFEAADYRGALMLAHAAVCGTTDSY